MKKTIDLNADLGEMDSAEGRQAEHDILRYVSSANIACGGHAGSPDIMRDRIKAAMKNGVVIGAHPAYPDREHFGRKSLTLGTDITAATLIKSVTAQIVGLVEIAAQRGAQVDYVKPHGTLYTDGARDKMLADLIAGCVFRLDPALILMGAPGSALERAAQDMGLRFIGEGFIDRRYGADGHLVPRGQDGAVITDQSARESQLLSLALSQSVLTMDGQTISVNAQTLCLHGDSAGAVDTAQRARKALEAAGLTVRSFVHG